MLLRSLGAVGVTLTLVGCGSAGPATPTDPTLAQRTPRTPALAPCPVPGGESSLPDVALACFTGAAELSTAQLGGRPVLVNLWASWCAPCQRETPMLVQVHRRFGSAVTFLGVDTQDERGSAADFLAAFGVTYPQLSDPDGRLLHRLGSSGLPITLLLDRDGRVAFTQHGELKPAALQRALEHVTTRADR